MLFGTHILPTLTMKNCLSLALALVLSPFLRAEVPGAFVKEINGVEAVQLLKTETAAKKADPTKPPLIVLDVRTADEFATQHIPGAINVDFLKADFKAGLAPLPKDQPALVHCAAGGRSAKALEVLKAAGFTKIYHLKDGFKGWIAAGGPVEKKMP